MSLKRHNYVSVCPFRDIKVMLLLIICHNYQVQVQMRQSALGRWRVRGGLQVLLRLVNVRGLPLEALHVPFLMHSSETMIWKEKERFRISIVQMDKLRGFLGIIRIDKVLNARIRELCGVKKRLDEGIDEDVLRWFDQVERTENDSIAKRF